MGSKENMEVIDGQKVALEHKKAAPFPKLLRDNHIALLSI
jgi:hypothetical protein